MSRVAFCSVAVGMALLVGSAAHAAQKGLCKFDTVSLRFAGSAAEQASCLLRKVEVQGPSSTPQPVPDWLLQRVEQPIKITASALSQYLDKQKIDAKALGGPIDDPARVSKLRYFVIHDTSSPELSGVAEFPSNINEPSWSGNKLTGWASTAPKVHLITNRVGESRAFRKLWEDRPKTATKLEGVLSNAKRVFIHVENIQPRIKPPGSWAWKSPNPGFSPAQIERIALLYLSASVWKGKWLIPAFHFNIDWKATLKEPHDDPQGFDLAAWVDAVKGIATELGESSP